VLRKIKREYVGGTTAKGLTDKQGEREMIEQYQPQIDEIRASLAREDLSNRQRLLWVFKIGKLSEKILSDYETQAGNAMTWPQAKDQVQWLDNWEEAERKLLFSELDRQFSVKVMTPTTHNLDVDVHYIGHDMNGDHFTVWINGKKYPREHNTDYIGTEDKAKEWAIAESLGKYVSRGGMIFDCEEDYDKWRDAQW